MRIKKRKNNNGFFKYLGFICEVSRFITGVPKIIPQVLLTVGISFYTFQLISYVVDVYRGEVKADTQYWLLHLVTIRILCMHMNLFQLMR